MTGRAHVVAAGAGRAADLGVARMRVLADDAVTTAFSLTEFAGETEGPWTIPHLHQGFEESFFVLDGEFTFTVGGDPVPAGAGTYVLVPKNTVHTISAGPGGGRFLTLMVPGGLEKMFLELAGLPPNAITDPVARKEVSARYDSIPV
ncbi:cupin domain-containing protein [Kribbella sp. NPDC004875]|uniref:cupin domain-containing protein n=1 Tax=Kribbella sp. NPDC004875 TaxID=3364107 RepID=UPI0036BC91D1